MSGFKELGIADDFVKGLSEIAITVPTSIQKEVIPALIDNDGDLMGKLRQVQEKLLHLVYLCYIKFVLNKSKYRH